MEIMESAPGVPKQSSVGVAGMVEGGGMLLLLFASADFDLERFIIPDDDFSPPTNLLLTFLEAAAASRKTPEHSESAIDMSSIPK